MNVYDNITPNSSFIACVALQPLFGPSLLQKTSPFFFRLLLVSSIHVFLGSLSFILRMRNAEV